MIVKVSGIVTEKFESDKGNTYLTLVDISTGGMCKLTYQGQTIEAKSGDQLTGEVEVKPTIGKYGLQLSVLGGSFQKKGG
ncbi:MAG: hypothetical protein IH595_14845 [Bacteroidales bacterium]|nr:hypothetical protein [Bacteroidales bacterium]